MKAVAFLTMEYPLPSMRYTGGIGTSIKNLADFYLNQGIRVFIFIYGQKEDRVMDQEGKTFVLIKQVFAGGIGWLVNRFRIQRIVNKMISQEGIEMIEIPDWTGISAFIRLDCLTVLKLHGSDTFFCHLEGRKVKSRNRWFEKMAFKNADQIIAVSNFVGRKSCDLFGIERSFEVIPNGIQLIKSMNNGEIYGSAEKSILYFGSLIRKKGALEIPKIFNLVHRKCPNTRLVLAGNDAFDIQTGETSTWVLMKREFHPDVLPFVDYLGLIKHDQIGTLIKKADICIFPSYAEAFPVSWLEAMSHGKAVVCSNIGWSAEVILDDSVGLTTYPGDHHTYADHIHRLLEDDELRERMGKAAKACVVQNFSIEKVGARHLEVLGRKLKNQ